MQDYNYHQLIEQIGNMSAWKIFAVNAVTAEKVSPIVRTLGLPNTWQIVERSLALAWRSLSNSKEIVTEAEQLLNELNAVPEWQCENPDTLTFFLSMPLDIIHTALSAINMERNVEMVHNIGFSHILDIADQLDVAASDYPDLDSIRIAIGNAEKSSQMSIVAALAQYDFPSNELLEVLKQESKSISTLIEGALPTFCFSFVSSLCRKKLQ